MAKNERVYHRSDTHEMYFPIPKPSLTEIEGMLARYFDGHAGSYDEFDAASQRRSLYTAGVNRIIAEDLKRGVAPSLDILSIGCGTGRRETEIAALLAPQILARLHGVEHSSAMASNARARGIQCDVSAWPDEPEGWGTGLFDVVLHLFAFGHVPTHTRRVLSLQRMRARLKPGASIYLDVFNLDDKTEWGPMIRQAFCNLDLGQNGYECGDFFYRRVGSDDPSYIHYFAEDELRGLCQDAGLRVADTWYVGYANRAGEVLGDKNEGLILLKLQGR
jgi:SAM-dependent methyltransferase